MGRTSDSKERIIESAARLWHSRSYDDVGVAEICTDAGVQKGSFYHFFPSKEDLVLEVLEAHWRGMERIFGPCFSREIPPLERFERYLGAMGAMSREFLLRDQCFPGCPLGNLATELGTRDSRVRLRVEAIFDRVRAMYRGAIEDAIACGQLPVSTDAETLSGVILTYVQGLAVVGKTYRDAGFLESMGAQLFALLGARAQSP